MSVPLAQLLFEPEPLLSPGPWQKAVAADERSWHNVTAREALPSLANHLTCFSSASFFSCPL